MQTNEKTKEGVPYFKVTFPKYKLGDELVREIAVALHMVMYDNISWFS